MMTANALAAKAIPIENKTCCNSGIRYRCLITAFSDRMPTSPVTKNAATSVSRNGTPNEFNKMTAT